MEGEASCSGRRFRGGSTSALREIFALGVPSRLDATDEYMHFPELSVASHMKLVCARCRSEGKPGDLGERAPLEDHAPTHSICARHQEQFLESLTSASFPDIELLLVVHPKDTALYEVSPAQSRPPASCEGDHGSPRGRSPSGAAPRRRRSPTRTAAGSARQGLVSRLHRREIQTEVTADEA